MAGEVLRLLQGAMPSDCSFSGYDISPQALTLCQTRANEKLQFKLADIAEETSTSKTILVSFAVFARGTT